MSARKDAKEILDKSIDLIKEISAKIQQEAGKTWKISTLKFEILGLRRRKNEELKLLGERVLALLREGRIKDPSLERFIEEVHGIEQEIRTKEEEIKKVEELFKGYRSPERDRGRERVEVSKEKGAKGNSMAAPITVSRGDSGPGRPAPDDDPDFWE